MRRVVKITEPEYFEIEFADGTVKKAIFNNMTFLTLVEEYGGVESLQKEAVEEPFKFSAKLLYAGLKLVDSTITYQEAMSITLAGGVDLVMGMFEMVNDNVKKLNVYMDASSEEE